MSNECEYCGRQLELTVDEKFCSELCKRADEVYRRGDKVVCLACEKEYRAIGGQHLNNKHEEIDYENVYPKAKLTCIEFRILNSRVNTGREFSERHRQNLVVANSKSANSVESLTRSRLTMTRWRYSLTAKERSEMSKKMYRDRPYLIQLRREQAIRMMQDGTFHETQIEKICHEILLDLQKDFNFEIKKQYAVESFLVDRALVFSDRVIAVECHGEFWHDQEKRRKNIESKIVDGDRIREQKISLRMTLVVLWEDVLRHNQKLCKEILLYAIRDTEKRVFDSDDESLREELHEDFVHSFRSNRINGPLAEQSVS